MFLREVPYRDLARALYVVGADDEAAVVGPRSDSDIYPEMARSERMTITHVIDSHDHADHVSGRLLVAVTGACSHRSDPAREFSDGIHPGDEVAAGSVRTRAISTPSSTEHLAVSVRDVSRT